MQTVKMAAEDIDKFLKTCREDLDKLSNITKCENIQERYNELEKMLKLLGLIIRDIPNEKITSVLFNTIELLNNRIIEKMWGVKRGGSKA